LEHRPELPGRNEISKRENGEESFTEQELRAYLLACNITGELFEACMSHHQRIMQQATTTDHLTHQSSQHTNTEAGHPHSAPSPQWAMAPSYMPCEINEVAEYLVSALPYGASADQLIKYKKEIVDLLYPRIAYPGVSPIERARKVENLVRRAIAWMEGALYGNKGEFSKALLLLLGLSPDTAMSTLRERRRLAAAVVNKSPRQLRKNYEKMLLLVLAGEMSMNYAEGPRLDAPDDN